MFFLDTSVLVSSMTRETTSLPVRSWLADNVGEPFMISEWTRTEFASALALKVRMGTIDSHLRTAASDLFEIMCEESLTVSGVTAGDFRLAARFVGREATGLRAADSLHVAVAMRHGATLCTTDLGLIKACRLLDAPAINCCPMP